MKCPPSAQPDLGAFFCHFWHFCVFVRAVSEIKSENSFLSFLVFLFSQEKWSCRPVRFPEGNRTGPGHSVSDAGPVFAIFF